MQLQLQDIRGQHHILSAMGHHKCLSHPLPPTRVNPAVQTAAPIWARWGGNHLLTRGCPLLLQQTAMSIQSRTIKMPQQTCTIPTPVSGGHRAPNLTSTILVSSVWLVTCGHPLFSRSLYLVSFVHVFSPVLIALGLALGVGGRRNTQFVSDLHDDCTACNLVKSLSVMASSGAPIFPLSSVSA